MIYSQVRRLNRDGIPFDASDLLPIDIQEGSACWGVWVEGRGGVERCRFRDAANSAEAQAPHMIVSGIHPDLWPTTFTLQALLARKQWNRSDIPFRDDSVYGLTSALAACGVNIIVAQTAQVGYDLEVFNAVCEFPGLRPFARDVLRGLEKEFAHIQREYEPAQHLKRRHDARINAFQAIGRAMISHLVLLQARLTVIDDARRKRTRGPHADEARIATDKTGNARAVREMLTGQARASGMPDVLDVLKGPDFLNEKILHDGAYTYFLNSDDACSLDGEHWPFSRREEWVSKEHLPARPDGGAVNKLWDEYKNILSSRTPSGPLHGRYVGHEIADQMNGLNSWDEVRRLATRRFFERQAMLPLRILALHSLAYARIWAFPPARDEKDPWTPFAFITTGENGAADAPHRPAVLSPVSSAEEQRPLGAVPLVNALNRMTGCEAYPPPRRYDDNTVVLCSMHIRDRFVRLRFLRSSFARAHCARLVVRYEAARDDEYPIDSRGLLQGILHVLCERGLRVERHQNRFTYMSVNKEAGQIEVLVKATSTGATEELADPQRRQQICRDIDEAIESLSTAGVVLTAPTELLEDAIDR